MTRGLEDVALVALWLVVLWRLPTVRRGQSKRTLWEIFIFLALATTFSQPEVIRALDGVRPNLAALGKATATVGAASAVAMMVAVTTTESDAVVARARRRIGTAAVLAVAGLAVCYLLLPRQVVPDFLPAFAGRRAGGAYWAIYLVYLVAALVLILVLIVRRLRQPGPSRPGLSTNAVGVLVALVYVLQRAWYVADRQLGVDTLGPVGAVSVTRGLMASSLILLAVGTLQPSLITARQEFAAYVLCLRLYPLWRAVYQVCPQVHLGPAPQRRARDALGAGRDGHSWRYQLRRRVVEINDGMLTLCQESDALTMRSHGPRLRAAVAAHNRAAHAQAEPQAAWRDGVTEDLGSEARRLLRISAGSGPKTPRLLGG